MEENKQISINGKYISGYQYFTLSQRINDHHSFEIGIDVEEAEKQGEYNLNESKKWLGKTVIINRTGKDFTGIITHISFNKEDGGHGLIILSGYSSTIVLEGSKLMRSWLDKSLSDIVKTVTKNPRLSVSISPEFKSVIEYESQYLETNFGFIQRLAKHYNEWLFYDGDTLFFGKPEKTEPIRVEYGRDITSLSVGIQTRGNKLQSFSYNSMGDEQFNGQAPDSPSGLNELGQFAFNASLETFTEPGNEYPLRRVKSKAELDDYIKRKQQSLFASTNYISAESKAKGLKVGSIIDLESIVPKANSKGEIKKHGKYIIIEITHYGRVGNHYHNTFIALPADIKVLPEPEVGMPTAEIQMATVVSNEDPKKKGRVQVRMNWQSGEMKTSWIRVMTPDGGSSDKKSSNRGFVFIPEKGDKVLIGFRYNNPNRPFIMGSLFNGNSGSGGGDQNKTKSITTRSGSTITFDDDKGNINISDPSGNTVTLNGDGTISITAPESLTISSKKITFNASETVDVNGINEINIKTKKATIIGTDEVNINSETKINEKAPSVNINGDSTSIEGGTITTSSTGETNITGSLVKINS